MWLEFSWWRFYFSGGEPTMVEYHLADSDVNVIRRECNILLQEMGFDKLECYDVTPSQIERGVYICRLTHHVEFGL